MSRRTGSQDKLKALFAKYIGPKRVVICDPSIVARGNIAQTLTSMGAKTANLALTSTYDEAEEEITRSQPKIVITEYDLARKCGLDLLQKQRQERPETKDMLFVLITGNTSQTAVAKAAEEDVDTYVLKPFSADVLRSSILKAALLKIDPPEYLKLIERGKTELSEAKVDDAIKTFEHATKLDANPSLAFYYLGQTHLLKQLLKDAEGDYTKGLNHNKIHYKCLVGLYELLMSQQKHGPAYDIIRRISQYFPANPQRLNAVLRLAIITKSYEDVERYYRIFTSIDDRNEEMIKYVCAALVVCGKYYLQQTLQSRALELFQKAAVTGSARTWVLREIISALVEHDLLNQAEEFLMRFTPEARTSADYLAMSILILDKEGNRSLVVKKCREAINGGQHDPLIYRLLVERSLESGMGAASEDLCAEALKRFGNDAANKKVFDHLLMRVRSLRAA